MALLSFNTLIACLPCRCQTDCSITRLCLVKRLRVVVAPSLESRVGRKELVSKRCSINVIILRLYPIKLSEPFD